MITQNEFVSSTCFVYENVTEVDGPSNVSEKNQYTATTKKYVYSLYTPDTVIFQLHRNRQCDYPASVILSRDITTFNFVILLNRNKKDKFE